MHLGACQCPCMKQGPTHHPLDNISSSTERKAGGEVQKVGRCFPSFTTDSWRLWAGPHLSEIRFLKLNPQSCLGGERDNAGTSFHTTALTVVDCRRGAPSSPPLRRPVHRPEWAWKTCPNLSLTCLTRAKPKFLWPKPSSPPPTSNHVLLRNEIHVFLNHSFLLKSS